jgi:hypothetical protein
MPASRLWEPGAGSGTNHQEVIMNSSEERNKRSPEDIAKDLENIVFPEVDEEELKDVFGGIGETLPECGSNVNCGC